MKSSFIIIIILILTTSINSQRYEYITGGLNEHSTCMSSENSIGVCRKASDCQNEFKRYLNNEIVMKICQNNVWNYNDPFICCPEQSSPSTVTASQRNIIKNKNMNIEDDFFNFEKCRDRHLHLRSKNSLEVAVAVIGWTQYDQSVRYSCGGVIISEWFIITAASCRGAERYPDKIRVGDKFLYSTQDDDHAQQFGIEKFIQHPDFRSFSVYHDIAVVKSDGKIMFNEFVAPACIEDINNESIKLKIQGFRQIQSYYSFSLALSEISLNIYANNYCNQMYLRDTRVPNGISSNQICTIGERDLQGNYQNICGGDTGTSIQYKFIHEVNNESAKNYEIPVVVGIVSFITTCGYNNLPSISTRISPYRDWILSVMNELNSSTIGITSTSTINPISSSSTTIQLDTTKSSTNLHHITTLSAIIQQEFTTQSSIRPPRRKPKTLQFDNIQQYNNNYFNIETCRERNLVFRRFKKHAKDLINEVVSRTREMTYDDCDNIHQTRFDSGVDCQNGYFYHILHGTEAKEFDWPFMAAIGWTQNDESVKYLCGGVILSEKFIATAAHCRGSKKFPNTVRVGDRFLSTPQDDNHAQQLKVEKFIFHPKYDGTKAYFDIAMIKTVERINFNNHVTLACIGDVIDDRMKLKIAGYGKIDVTHNKPSKVLHEITVDIFPIENCSDVFYGDTKVSNGIEPSQICVKGEENSDGNYPDSCRGDSGGPVQYIYEYEVKDANYESTKLKTVYEIPMIVGLVSFGSECGLNVPSVNTRISHYKSWILCVMNDLMLSTNNTAGNCK